MGADRTCPSCGGKLPTNAPQGLCPECLMKAGFPSGGAPKPGDPTRGPAFVPPTIEELTPLFPQLEIIQVLGHGGMGAVYKARQPALDRVVALKILPPRPANDVGFAERFNREARALAKLSHPNIVAVHDFGVAGTFHYFLMEYVEGGNLRELQEAGKFSPKEALKIVPQICEALQYAHEEGIVHRDIKPENVMLDKRGRVKITDFGLAKITGLDKDKLRLTGARDVMGTPHYMAPEQIERPQEVDHRADIYSLGVVFYEMLTGELPLGRFAPPSKKVQVDVRLDEVVLHTLEKEPTRRYQHAGEVKDDVERIVSGKTVVMAAPPESEQKHRLGRGMARVVSIARWTARFFSILLLLFYGFFMLAEGLPAIMTQPAGVQAGFLALGLMLLGFVIGWRREGVAAILIALGWTLWHAFEPAVRWNVFQTPLPVAALFAFCWWAMQGRRTRLVLGWVGALVIVFIISRLFVPVNVFLHGAVLDAGTGLGVPEAEFFVKADPPGGKVASPQARSGKQGNYRLYLGWHSKNLPLRISAPGYVTLTTNVGPRGVGQKSVPRDFTLQPVFSERESGEEFPSVVVATVPEAGAVDVDPSLKELRVTFSRPMADKSWSWVKVDEESFPEMTGEPRFLPGQRTCVLPVRLQPGRIYALWLNHEPHMTFQSMDHVPSMPYLLVFKTRN